MRNSTLILLLLLLCSCTDGAAGTARLALPADARSMQPEAGQRLLASLDDFTLSLIPDPQLGIPEGNFQLHAIRTEDTLQLELSVLESRALRGLLLQLDYDAQRWQALSAEAGSLLAGGGTLLQLADLGQPGKARLGQVLANWDECEGVDGNGVLAQFSFREGSSGMERRSSQVADADSARARLEFLQAGDTQRLIWFHTNPGDYNQDGVVSISDLTPLGQNFGRSGPFAHSSAEAVVDGDGNDEINISDLTVIGQNLGNEVMEYAVYWSSRPDLDIPEDNSADLGQTASATLDGSEQFNPFSRRRYVWDIDNESALLPGSVLWVRPLDGAGHPGTPSNHTGEDNGDPAGQAPVVNLAVSQFSGEVPLTITMDASKSFDPRGGGIDSFSYIVDNEPLASFSGYQLSDESYTVEITEAGSYMLSLSATHGGFTSTTRPVLLSVTQGGNRAPLAVASLPNIFSFVRTPATYLIDFTDSYDPDGDPLSFELDLWSGTRAIPLPRGDFEISNPAGTQYELTIVEPGPMRSTSGRPMTRACPTLTRLHWKCWLRTASLCPEPRSVRTALPAQPPTRYCSSCSRLQRFRNSRLTNWSLIRRARATGCCWIRPSRATATHIKARQHAPAPAGD
ncbi:MAG: hypothetical protein R3F46_03955 [bacterium]